LIDFYLVIKTCVIAVLMPEAFNVLCTLILWKREMSKANVHRWHWCGNIVNQLQL